jgi:hypothetical protein
MPLCPQITNTPITVTQTADFTVSSVLPVVAATTTQLDAVEVLIDGKAQIYYQTTAPVGATVTENDLWYDTDDGNKPYVYRSGVWVSAQDGSIATAQSAANTALTNAATANSNAATAQSTANTALTNAATANTNAINSLQPSAYAIQNPTTKQLTAIDATGLTVYSGASSTSGARVVLNSTGLAGFNSGGSATFSVSASTGAAVFSGSVTGATITGGTLNIGGNAIIDASGFLTATGATITGTITTSNITVTGGTLTIGSKFSVTSTGVLTATDGVFTGQITSTNATITGGSLTVGSTFAVTSAGVLTATGATITGTLTASAGTIGGWKLSGTSLFTGTAGSETQYLSASGGGLLTGTYTIGALGVNNNLTVGANMEAAGTIKATGNLFALATIGSPSVSNATNTYLTTTGIIAKTSTTSSQRYKENITDLMNVPELNPKKLLDLPVRAFAYKDGHLSATDDRFGQMLPGFIAEEMDAIYPIAVDYENGVETWNSFYVIPALLALIQDQEKRIKQLEGE